MAEVIISQLLAKLASFGGDEDGESRSSRSSLLESVRKLRSNLTLIKPKVEDAERRQFDEVAVRVWLAKVKHTCYDLEDVLDGWNTAILKSKLENQQKRVSFISSLSGVHQMSLLFRQFSFANRIKKLSKTLKVVVASGSALFDANSANAPSPLRAGPSSLNNMDPVLGRDQCFGDLARLLTQSGIEEGSTLEVITIEGFEGIGKTTIAELVFNNEDVVTCFDKKIWVPVSGISDAGEIAKEILKSVIPYDVSDQIFDEPLQIVIERIQTEIQGKKILIVFDNAWQEQVSFWEPLIQMLRCGQRGSKILLTTRKEKVATSFDGKVPTERIQVPELSPEYFKLFFREVAFTGKTEEECKNLEDIVMQFATKCKHSPLAAKTLGSLVLNKKTREEWQSVLNCDIWKLEEAEKGLFHSLMLTYYTLPSGLRQCVSYFAIFPRDYVIEKDWLIKLWMAQGFLGECDQHLGRHMAEIGGKYFKSLEEHHFFHEFEKDEKGTLIRCKLRSYVREFALFLARNESFVVDKNQKFLSKDGRHYLMQTSGWCTMDFPSFIYKAKKLRTLILESSYDSEALVNLVLPKLFAQLTRLRTLHLKFPSVRAYPEEMGKLIHLRFLNLSHNYKLQELPEAVCDLYNLETLDLRWCLGLRKLPSGMGKLINLIHLENEGTLQLEFMPRGMDKLTCLQTLRVFVVHRDGATLGDLGNMIDLEGELEIAGLGKVRNTSEAEKAQLGKKNLVGLALYFDPLEEKSINGPLLESLKPPRHLERLKIFFYKDFILKDLFSFLPKKDSFLRRMNIRRTTWWPKWITSLTKLKELELQACEVETLPALGRLPSLQLLTICNLKSVVKVGVEFLRRETLSPSPNTVAFPKLKKLNFDQMDSWEEWEVEDNIIIMPCLRFLTISSCQKLKAIPDVIRKKQNLELKISHSDLVVKSPRRKFNDMLGTKAADLASL